MRERIEKNKSKMILFGIFATGILGCGIVASNLRVEIDQTKTRTGLLIMTSYSGMNLEYRNVDGDEKVFVWLRFADMYYTNTFNIKDRE